MGSVTAIGELDAARSSIQAGSDNISCDPGILHIENRDKTRLDHGG
jgi:hypothetical protein